jgi:hypothetical protein
MAGQGRDPAERGGLEDCPWCGAPGVGGQEGCNARFQEVVGREFTRPELFRVHRITVDAYSLQHPERYMKSAKSAVAHLVGMCWTLEGDGDPLVSVAVSRFLDGAPRVQRPHPIPAPGHRGEATILRVHAAPSSDAHLAAVMDWAQSAWRSWAEHHAQARQWMEQARMGRRPA